MNFPKSKQHEAALQLAAEGMHIFPCLPLSKKPAIKAWEQNATTEIGQIDAWWGQNENFNPAIACGPSNIWVIDEDPGADVEAILGSISTRTHTTPRGGRHFIFRGEGPTTASKLAPHVDTRGRGGYVLGPGATLPNGCYGTSDLQQTQPLPTELIERLETNNTPKPSQHDGLDELQNITRALAFLETRAGAIEGEGGNAWTYQTACAVKDFGISRELASDLLQDWNGTNSPPWDYAWLEDILDHAYAYGQNEPGSNALGPISELYDGLKGSPETKSDYVSSNYPKPLSSGELSQGSFPRPEHLVSQLILKSHVNLLYGHGGAGKTLIAEHMAVAVAAGLPFFGYQTIQSPVLLALAEDDNGETKSRLEAISLMMGVRLADLPITTWCLPGYDVCLAKVADDGTWKPGQFFEPLRSAIRETRAGLVVLDSLADIFALNESLRLPANTALKVVLGSFCREFGSTVLAIAHPSKASMNDGSGYAGSTAWNNAVRNRLTLERPDEDSPRRILKVAKANYGGDANLELFLNGTTFALASSSTEQGRQDAFSEACVSAALKLAGLGIPFQRSRAWPTWVDKEIEEQSGLRANTRDVREALEVAIRDKKLRYLPRGNTQTAGYYPFDLTEAKELAQKDRF